MNLPVLSPFSPLSSVLADIQRAIDAKLYYPALLVALTVPEFCSALALDRSSHVKAKHYIAFVDKYTTPLKLGLNGETCYRLRGGVVHRANMVGHAHFEADNVIFSLPGSNASMHNFSITSSDSKRALMLDLNSFCFEMRDAAIRWYGDHAGSQMVEESINNLIRYCPNGLSPYLAGPPVVASGA